MAVSTARPRTSASDTVDPPLRGLSAAAFLRRSWQKDALLIRSAIAGFTGPFDARQLFTLARRDDIESRLIIRDGTRWSLTHGPFRASDFAALPARNWTLLVQGVNLVSAAGDALLRRFAFLPYARLDDLMVSYAAPGGGVGPHVDSYDVFLLQGRGRRRWRLSRQRDLTLDPSLPVKILTHFRPDVEVTLDAGDMLYLPPAYAHDGIAASECTTCSIGFRAPSAQELGTAFLDWLRDSIALEGRYTDASSRPTAEPARIGRAMQERCASMLAGVRWNDAAVGRFLGCYLSEPKPSVFFEPPLRPLAAAAFLSAAARRGVSLDRRTQLLYDKHHVFLNGTALDWAGHDTALIKRLANARQMDGARLALAGPIRTSAAAVFYRWYCDGFLHLG